MTEPNHNDPGLDSTEYDTIILGTGLAESIIASYLARSASQKILHLDPFPSYGGTKHASLTIPELIAHLPSLASSSSSWPSSSNSKSTSQDTQANPNSKPNSFKDKAEQTPLGRHYSLSLYPSLIPSRGPLIDTLIDSGVSNYLGFRVVDGVGVYSGISTSTTTITTNINDGAGSSLEQAQANISDDEGKADLGEIKRFPSSKSDIFRDKSMSLVEKRRLMKMLVWVMGLKGLTGLEGSEIGGGGGGAGEGDEGEDLFKGKGNLPLSKFLVEEFGLSREMADDVTLGLAHADNLNASTSSLLPRLSNYLHSLSRYSSASASPFLTAQYGGIGEIVQGFCRSCAVGEGVYILGGEGGVVDMELVEQEEGEGMSGDGGVRIKIGAHRGGEEWVSARRIIASQISLDGHLDERIRTLRQTQKRTAKERPDTAGSIAGEPTPALSRDRKSYSNCIAILPSLPTIVKSAFSPQGKSLAGTVEEEEEEAVVQGDDVILLVFPPRSREGVESGSAEGVGDVTRVLFMGSGTGSCPDGEYVMYIQTRSRSIDSDPRGVLAPVYDALFPPAGDLKAVPHFVAYYNSYSTYQHSSPPQPPTSTSTSSQNPTTTTTTTSHSIPPLSLASQPLIILDDIHSALTSSSSGNGDTDTAGNGLGEPEWIEGTDMEARIAGAVIRGLVGEMMKDRGGNEGEGEDGDGEEVEVM